MQLSRDVQISTLVRRIAMVDGFISKEKAAVEQDPGNAGALLALHAYELLKVEYETKLQQLRAGLDISLSSRKLH